MWKVPFHFTVYQSALATVPMWMASCVYIKAFVSQGKKWLKKRNETKILESQSENLISRGQVNSYQY